MPSVLAPHSPDIDLKKKPRFVEEGDDNSESMKSQQIDRYIDDCRSLYNTHLINDKTRDAYDKMWEGLRAEQKVTEMQENVSYLSRTVAAAENYEQNFLRKLENATQQKWIGKKTRDNWLKRFYDPNVLEWDRKKWLDEHFDHYYDNWRIVANERKDLRKFAKKLNVTDKDIPELEGVWKIQDFLALHADERKNKVRIAMAALHAHEKAQDALFTEVKNELAAAARNGFMHESKVGEWLLRAMQAEDPQAYMKKTIRPFLHNWQAARQRFDALEPQLKQHKDLLRGFTMLNADQFLRLTYPKRIAYLNEADARLGANINERSPIAALRLDIRHAMDTKQWEEAELLLSQAKNIDPNDPQLIAMQEYLLANRPAQTGGTTLDAGTLSVDQIKRGTEALKTLRELQDRLPEGLKWYNEQALATGDTEVLKRLWQTIYNRKWVREHGYSTNLSEKAESQSDFNKEKTHERIANGHDRGREHNIIDGDTADTAGILDDCVTAQTAHVGRSGRSEYMKAVIRNKDNGHFGYWTTFHPTDVPYESQDEAIEECMYHIKKNATILRQCGLRFTAYGAPASLN